jgi:hypothetical protein
MFRILLAMLALMLVMVIGFGYYYNSSQATINTLVTEKATLAIGIGLNEETIRTLEADNIKVNASLAIVNADNAAARAANRILVDKLGSSDIGFLAQNKPELVQNIINNASDKALRCFELLSGASLTNTEREATNGRQFNSECPWLYTP